MKYNINFFFLKNYFYYKIRLDKLLTFYLVFFSRKFINNYILKGNIYINNPCSLPFFSGNLILKFFTHNILFKTNLKYFKKYIDIIYEDDYLIIINKPSGLLIHSNLNKLNNNLVESLLNYYGKKILLLFRLGILHRLDKNTSGLVLIFKLNYFYINFLKQIKHNIINKYYFSINYGKYEYKKKIIGYINYFYKKKKYNLNFFSITNFLKFRNFFFKENLFLLKSNLITGRTHQLRIHFNFIKFPIIGDFLFNNLKNFNIYKSINRHILHCYYLSFFHPIFNKNIFLNTYLPSDILNFLYLNFRDGGIWTLDSIELNSPLAGECFKPLSHISFNRF